MSLLEAFSHSEDASWVCDVTLLTETQRATWRGNANF